MYLRDRYFQDVVLYDLFTSHDNGQLYTQLYKAASRTTLKCQSQYNYKYSLHKIPEQWI